jgi:hypothetical protein
MKRLLFCLLIFSAPAFAWWPKGHSIVTEAAVRALPVSKKNGNAAGAALPHFFRTGTATIAHCAQDPDVFKNRATPALNDRESPDHYMDWELLGERQLPEKRSFFVALCAREKLDPENIGYLPYAVAESTERLAIAFAEHRKWPRNRHIQRKTLIYAGLLAHYSGDLQMPLHVTIHHDGRAKPNGASPRSGIHARLDSLIEKLSEKKLLSAKSLAQGQQIAPLSGALFPGIVEEMQRSRAQVDRAYELENLLPQEGQAWMPDAQIVEFGAQRGREAARFTAALYLTAWRRSAEIKLPEWLEREAVR